MRRLFNFLWTLLNVAVAAGLLCSAWGSAVDPRTWAFPAVLAMALPLVVPPALMMLVVDMIWWRRNAVVVGAAMLLSLPQILTVFPANFPAGEPSEAQRREGFTLLTYNVMNCSTLDGEFPDSLNQVVSYILAADADVVCMQEIDSLSATNDVCITPAQADSVSRRYPYRIFDSGQHLGVLSKFPMQALPLSYRPGEGRCGTMMGVRLDVHGAAVDLYDVHLESFRLTINDKQLYRDVATMKGGNPIDELRQVRHSLVSKLEEAAVKRACQADTLAKYIGRFNTENVIVSGDFNDVPGCRTIRRLGELGLDDAYPYVGNGYMPTYNSNGFLFTIDHVLWRGRFRPWSVIRGDVKFSDHYPLLVTFVPVS